MAYSTLIDMEKIVPREKIDELCRPSVAGDVVPDLIDEIDGVIDQHNTSNWDARARKGCSRALAAKLLYGRHGSGKVPKHIEDLFAFWEARLNAAGLRQNSWSGVAYNPVYQETQADLNLLRRRPQ